MRPDMNFAGMANRSHEAVVENVFGAKMPVYLI